MIFQLQLQIFYSFAFFSVFYKKKKKLKFFSINPTKLCSPFGASDGRKKNFYPFTPSSIISKRFFFLRQSKPNLTNGRVDLTYLSIHVRDVNTWKKERYQILSNIARVKNPISCSSDHEKKKVIFEVGEVPIKTDKRDPINQKMRKKIHDYTFSSIPILTHLRELASYFSYFILREQIKSAFTNHPNSVFPLQTRLNFINLLGRLKIKNIFGILYPNTFFWWLWNNSVKSKKP